jgi:membrane-bound lytic murein transglycosylase D
MVPTELGEPVVAGVAAAPAGPALVEVDGTPPGAPTAPATTAPPAAAASAAELEKDALAAAAVADGSPAPVATAPLAQSVRRGDEVFARIRRSLGPDVCAAGGNSERWRRRYASNPGAFANRLETILPLLDFVSVEVERVGLPGEFTFIPLVESWYKPEAMGAGGPAGMWQMIGSTARNHGIHIQPGYDGRLSPVESTRAALSYLKVLHDMFGGWQATVMAYNAGEGRMMEAFRRARTRDTSGDRRRPHGLSNITYDYVAKLQALSCLVAQPERNKLQLPRGSRFVPLAPVLMEPGVSSLEQFADRQGRNPGDLRRLNPGYRDGRVVAGVPRLVLMPLGIPQAEPAPVAAVLAANELVSDPSTTPVGSAAIPIHAPGTLADTAAPAPPGGPRGDPEDTTPPAAAVVMGDAEVAATGSGAAMMEVSDVAPAQTHHVVAGESLWTIAHLHQLSIEQLRRINRLDSHAVVHPGQTLKLLP